MKNKGIVIELTALLDVILIMLFWVMMSMEHEKEVVHTEAEETIAAKEAEFEQRVLDISAELDAVKTQYNRFLDENAEEVAVANQKALDEFAQGHMITLNLTYDAVGKLFILDETGELAHTLINTSKDYSNKTSKGSIGTTSEDVASIVSEVIRTIGFEENDVILCALVYDGKRALYRDINMIKKANEIVGSEYNNFYCTYINTSF